MNNIDIGSTFSDYLIKPAFSFIESRKDVSVKTNFLGESIFPILPSNMDTIASPEMVAAMVKSGAIGSLHRFMSIEDNIAQLDRSIDLMVQSGTRVIPPICSFGIGDNEYKRALALADAGADILLLDVAHGAAIHVVQQYNRVRSVLPNSVKIIVGNFADADGILEFNKHVHTRPDSYKAGIGPGSACLTRVVTGCGLPMLGSLYDCVKTGFPIIADGGMKNSGDIAKAFAAGAVAVMVGGLLAGTDETPGEICDRTGVPLSRGGDRHFSWYKKYRGSASSESYEVQGKTASHRAPEGDSMLVPYKGPVGPVIEKLEAGVRSALTYVGARNLVEFRERAKFIKVSSNAVVENSSHGKSNG